MAELNVTLGIMLPMFLLLLTGYGLSRIGWMKPEVTAGVNRLIFRLMLPVLLFNNMRQMDLQATHDLKFLLFPLVGVLLIFLISMVLVPRFEKDPRKRGVMVQGIFRTNFAILGVPLTEAMFGANGCMAFTLCLPVVIPLNNVLAVVALSAFTGGAANKKKLAKSILTNPLIIGCALGAIVLFSGLRLPPAVDTTLNKISGLTSTLSLIVLGASMQWKGIRNNGKQLLWTVLLKQLIIPAVMMAAAVLLGFTGTRLAVMIILFGAPCAVSSFAMASAMGGDEDLAAGQVVLTTFFSMGTLFAMIYVGKLMGLL